MAPDPLNVRLSEAERARLAQCAEQISLPPATLARLIIMAMLDNLEKDDEVLEHFFIQAREETLCVLPEEAVSGIFKSETCNKIVHKLISLN